MTVVTGGENGTGCPEQCDPWHGGGAGSSEEGAGALGRANECWWLLAGGGAACGPELM